MEIIPLRFRPFLVILFLSIFVTVFNSPADAIGDVSQNHFTIILNQVRGSECCGVGSLDNLKFQQAGLKKLNLIGNFALRYDVLTDSSFMSVVESDEQSEYGALLEITPELAKKAGAVYKSDVSKWYEAQNAFLIGYSQPDRKKIIDTYMGEFKEQLGFYPKFSSAWMIDAWSLAYLKQNYGISTHQLTREQFGTDSYTLYGGPVHYPYYPSKNWALIPDSSSETMPLIIRQTISDPVYVYGDKTDSYTSQPNDYFLRNDTTEYFKHLFTQAHTQVGSYTFALVGLENSMSEPMQTEFMKQLDFIYSWQNMSSNNKVVSVSDFELWRRSQVGAKMSIYHGVSSKDEAEQAWWINTSKYRARVRLSSGNLSITDLRIYDKNFRDPYYESEAKSLGWWVVPFVLDGSRYFEGSSDGTIIKNDNLKNRPVGVGNPIGINLDKDVEGLVVEETEYGKLFKTDNKQLVLFGDDQIKLFAQPNLESLNQLPKPLVDLGWTAEDGKNSWGFNFKDFVLKPFVSISNLDLVRNSFKSMLFPEKQLETFDAEKSSLYVNNDYAQVGRNPVRLVLFPKNAQGTGILLPKYPQIMSSKEVKDISVHEQHQNNGMIFIDLSNDKPLETTVTVKYEDFEKKLQVYFSPNCKNEKLYCLLHPKQFWWYLKTYLGDKTRAEEEIKQKTELFVDG